MRIIIISDHERERVTRPICTNDYDSFNPWVAVNAANILALSNSNATHWILWGFEMKGLSKNHAHHNNDSDDP